MANGKITKAEINGVDITNDVKLDTTVFAYPKRTLWLRIRDWWNYRKFRKAWKKARSVTVEFTGIYDPLEDYRRLHRN